MKIILCFAMMAIAAIAENAYSSSSLSGRVFPEKNWKRASPAFVGLDSLKLDSATNYLASICGPRKADHALIIRHGYLVWQGRDSDTAFDVWSCTKSFTSTILGLLIADKRCSLNSKAVQFVPAFKEKYPAVTMRHFATMTSGVQSTKGNKPFDLADPLFKPGEYFHYGDDLNMFGYVLTTIAKEPIRDLFKRRIADPIGMDSAHWSWGDWGDVDGIAVNGGSGTFNKGIHVSAREFARFGYLLLNHGNWNGKQLLDRSWIEQATRPQTDTTVRPFDRSGWYTSILGAYGYNFWVNGVVSGGQRLWESAPPRTFAIQGNCNSYCIVIPEWDMVIVRIGNDAVIDNKLYNGFFTRISAALKTR